MQLAYTFAILWLLLAFIGLGWARLVLRGANWGPALEWVLAPILGVFVVILPAFALIRFCGPVATWAVPQSAILIAVSGLLCAKIRPRKRTRRAFPVAHVCLAFAILLPALLGGEQFIAFRSNPSDANTYQTLAESTQRAPWSLIQKAGDRGTPAELAALAEQSPTALFSARFTRHPMRINSMLFLGWASSVTLQPVHSIYYAASLLFVQLLVSLVLGAGILFGLDRQARLLVAAAIAVGFWTYLSLETDAVSQLHIAPFLLLHAAASIGLLRWPHGNRLRTFFLTGVAGLAGVILFYPEAASFPAFAAAATAAALLLRRPAFWRFLKFQAGFGLLALGVLAASLQIDFIFRNVAFIARFVGSDAGYPSVVIEGMQRHGLGFLSGFIPAAGGFPPRYDLAIGGLGRVLAALTLATGLGATMTIACRLRRAPTWWTVSLMIPVAGLLICIGLQLRGSGYLSGKVLMWSLPVWTILFGFLATIARQNLSGLRRPYGEWLAWLARATLAGMIAFLFVAARTAATDTSLLTVRRKEADYSLSHLMGIVQSRHNAPLRVHVPIEGNWAFAMHVIRCFQDTPGVGFDSGYVWDNRNDNAPMQFGQLLPERFTLLLLRGTAPIPRRENTEFRLIAETPDLRLYEVNAEEH